MFEACEYEEINRRRFMSSLAASAFGVSLGACAFNTPSLASAPGPRSARARSVIVLNMRGGMSHIDTLDTKPENKAIQGPVTSIDSAADNIRISEYLPRLAGQMDKCSLINSLQSTQGAHLQAQYLLRTSYVKRGTISHPCLGSWVMRLSGKNNYNIPNNIVINSGVDTGSGYMESKYAPLPIGDPSKGLQHSKRHEKTPQEVFDRRLSHVREMNNEFLSKYNVKDVRAYQSMYDEALKLMNSRDLEAFDINKESDYLRAAYGDHSFGKGCLLARRLVEYDVRFVEVVLNGWDTHNDNFERVGELAQALDAGIASLLADLEARGLLETTMVALVSEFGRTPKIDAGRNLGRNHHPKAFSYLLAGGGIKRGYRYGKSDEHGHSVVENPVTIQDFNATLAYGLGLDLKQVITSPSKRPFTIVDKGRPILELFA